MCVIDLQWKCPLAISKWWKVKTWTTLSTFFWHDTSKNVKSRVFGFWKKRKKRILELCLLPFIYSAQPQRAGAPPTRSILATGLTRSIWSLAPPSPLCIRHCLCAQTVMAKIDMAYSATVTCWCPTLFFIAHPGSLVLYWCRSSVCPSVCSTLHLTCQSKFVYCLVVVATWL